VNYTANDANNPIYWDVPNQKYQFAEVRNGASHYGYIGADHTFNPDLTGSLRGGVRYTDYYNDPNGQTQLTPYFRASMRYVYATESFAELGLQYDQTATDLIGATSSGSFTTSGDTITVFGSVTHRIMPKLYGSLIGQYQYSRYNGGYYDGQAEAFYTAGLNLEYRFNMHFSGDVGYNYDYLSSDIGRTYGRNRVYLGLTARY